jgi:hypothetical protein
MKKKSNPKLEEIVEDIVNEALTWSQEFPYDPWYRNQIRPLVKAAFELGKKSQKI